MADELELNNNSFLSVSIKIKWQCNEGMKNNYGNRLLMLNIRIMEINIKLSVKYF